MSSYKIIQLWSFCQSSALDVAEVACHVRAAWAGSYVTLLIEAEEVHAKYGAGCRGRYGSYDTT